MSTLTGPLLADITQRLERVAAGLLSLVSARAATGCGLPFKALQHRIHVVSQGSITAALEFGLRGAFDTGRPAAADRLGSGAATNLAAKARRTITMVSSRIVSDREVKQIRFSEWLSKYRQYSTYRPCVRDPAKKQPSSCA